MYSTIGQGLNGPHSEGERWDVMRLSLVLEAAKTFIRLGFDQRGANPSIPAYYHTANHRYEPFRLKTKEESQSPVNKEQTQTRHE